MDEEEFKFELDNAISDLRILWDKVPSRLATLAYINSLTGYYLEKMKGGEVDSEPNKEGT